MNENQNSPYAVAVSLGMIAIGLTVVLSLAYWTDEITAALDSISMVYVVGLYSFWMVGSVIAIIYGSGSVREMGELGLVGCLFSAALTFSFGVSKILWPVINSNLPAWEASQWVVAGLGAGAALILLGLGGLRFRGVKS